MMGYLAPRESYKCTTRAVSVSYYSKLFLFWCGPIHFISSSSSGRLRVELNLVEQTHRDIRNTRGITFNRGRSFARFPTVAVVRQKMSNMR